MSTIEKHPYDPEDREGWLKLRQSLDRIGGSEIGIIAGHSKYASPYSLFCEKTGMVEKDDVSEKEAVIQGHDLEQYVAERFERASGKKVEIFPYIMTNDDCPHLEATIDRKVIGENSGLECKTMQSLVMNKFKNGDFPLSYYDQCVSYLAVSELERWYLSILVFGTAFKVFMMTTDKSEYDRYEALKAKVDGASILTDEEQKEWASRFGWMESVCYVSKDELDACEKLANAFMSRVEAFRGGDVKAWPLDEIDGSEATKNALKKMYPVATEDSVVTFDSAAEYGVQDDGQLFIEAKSEDVIDLVEQRIEVAKTIKELQAEQSKLEDLIIAIMKDKEMFKCPCGKVTYKNSVTRKFAKVQEVEDYFAANNLEVPKGMITGGEPTRTLRFTEAKEKIKK